MKRPNYYYRERLVAVGWLAGALVGFAGAGVGFAEAAVGLAGAVVGAAVGATDFGAAVGWAAGAGGAVGFAAEGADVGCEGRAVG